MLQSCATELSELCEKISRDFSLPASKKMDEVILAGTCFKITHNNPEDGIEKLAYADKIADITVYNGDKLSLQYVVKGRYLAGQKQILEQTAVGKQIIHKIDKNNSTYGWTQKQIEDSQLVAHIDSANSDEVYELIRAHILA